MGGARIIPVAVALFLTCWSARARAEPPGWERRYEARAAALAADDVRGHFALARWCVQCDRPEEARRHLGVVLRLEPGHERARQELEGLGGDAEAPAAGGASARSGIPRSPGRYDLTLAEWQGETFASPVRYTLQVPEGAVAGTPLPLVLAVSFRANQTRDPATILDVWEGFEGYIAAVMGSPEYSQTYNVLLPAIAERLLAEGIVDRDAILVTDWRSGLEVAVCVGRRPDLFRFGYSDSTWGAEFLPEIPNLYEGAPVPEAFLERLRDAHVHMKFTGNGGEGGADDAALARVHAFWETLGVRDVAIDRYPDRSIGYWEDVRGLARAWFERKLREERRARERLPPGP